MRYWLYLGINFQKKWFISMMFCPSKEELNQQLWHQHIKLIYSIPFHLKLPCQPNHFFQQLIQLYKLGIPIIRCLDLIESMAKTGIPLFIIRHLKQHLQLGHGLSESLKCHPNYFDAFSVSLIECAQQAGSQFHTLEIWLTKQDDLQQFKKNLQHQLFYPLMVLAVSICFLVYFILYLIPKYQQFFANFGASIPYPLLVIQQPFYYGLALIIVLILIAYRHKLPIWSKIQNLLLWYTWIQLLAICIRSGLSFQQSLQIIAQHFPNASFLSLQKQMIRDVRMGHSIQKSLQQSKGIPPEIHYYLGLVQFNGASRELLQQCADILENQLHQLMKKLEKYLQPLILTFMMLLCGGFMFLIYLPLLEIGKIIQ